MHQSHQANHLLCDNESSLLAKVSGHSNNDKEIDDKIERCDVTTSLNSTKTKHNLNFARVSLKTIKNKITLNNSYSLTLLHHHVTSASNNKVNNHEALDHGQITNNNNNNNNDLMFLNNQEEDKSNSIGNNKNLIKSKSITSCLNDVKAIKEFIDDIPAGEKGMLCNENRINSISFENDDDDDDLNFCDQSDVVDNDMKTKKGRNDDLSLFGAAGDVSMDSKKSNDTNHFKIDEEINDNERDENLKSCDLIFFNSNSAAAGCEPEHEHYQQQRENDATILSPCSSASSNENNNEIVLLNKKKASPPDKLVVDDAEGKLLNVSHKRNTNPFLSDALDVSEETELAAFDDEVKKHHGEEDDDDEQQQQQQQEDDGIKNSSNFYFKNHKAARSASVSWDDEDYRDEEEVFGSVAPQRFNRIPTNDLIQDHEVHNLTSILETEKSVEEESHVNDRSFIIKSAIPTCSFQRQDYNRPCERDVDEMVVVNNGDPKREKKLFRLSKKKSCNLFTVPSFVRTKGKSLPSLKHVNLHYPDKTCNGSTVINCPTTNTTNNSNIHEKKYFHNFHTRAKYQLIKLGQKCKILTLHNQHQHHHHTQPSTIGGGSGNVRTTIVKTNTNHRKKYQYYNEINKSYRLDDFIRSTHLLSGNGEDNLSQNDVEAMAVNNGGGFQNPRNSVVYKSYKSEIDLTRNLTYLDAFLNEHFERERSTMETGQQSSFDARQKHKRVKSCSKNINYSKNVIQHSIDQTAPMINDTIDEPSIDDDYGERQFYDGNVTSSSFEYSTVMAKDRKLSSTRQRDIVQEIGNGKTTTGNTTSSSFSSDYASVYSGGSKEGRTATSNLAPSKLISTPEEVIEYCDSPSSSFLLNKQKRIQSRRLSQPIPEHTNSHHHHPEDDNESFSLFDEANFVDIKNSMKKFHPDLYNSVPQFEDFNTIEFNEHLLPYCHYGGEDETLKNPYANDSSPAKKRQQHQLSSSFNERNLVRHQDYLEHFHQQQMLTHDDIGTNSNDFTLKNACYNDVPNSQGSKAFTKYNENSLDVYCNQYDEASNELYGAERFSQNPTTQSIIPLGQQPHRVIVSSKSKRPKREVVLEYEC